MVNESVWSETPNHGCNINGTTTAYDELSVNNIRGFNRNGTTTANDELSVNNIRGFKSVDDLVQRCVKLSCQYICTLYQI